MGAFVRFLLFLDSFYVFCVVFLVYFREKMVKDYVKKVRDCWVEQDKLDVIDQINHRLKGEEVVAILKCFPIGSQSRVTACRLLGTKCSGIHCAEIVVILAQFLPKNWEWQIECLQEFAAYIIDPNNHHSIVQTFQTRNATEQAEHILRMTPRSHHLKEDHDQAGRGKTARPKKSDSFGHIKIDRTDSFFDF